MHSRSRPAKSGSYTAGPGDGSDSDIDLDGDLFPEFAIGDDDFDNFESNLPVKKTPPLNLSQNSGDPSCSGGPPPSCLSGPARGSKDTIEHQSGCIDPEDTADDAMDTEQSAPQQVDQAAPQQPEQFAPQQSAAPLGLPQPGPASSGPADEAMDTEQPAPESNDSPTHPEIPPAARAASPKHVAALLPSSASPAQPSGVHPSDTQPLTRSGNESLMQEPEHGPGSAAMDSEPVPDTEPIEGTEPVPDTEPVTCSPVNLPPAPSHTAPTSDNTTGQQLPGHSSLVTDLPAADAEIDNSLQPMQVVLQGHAQASDAHPAEQRSLSKAPPRHVPFAEDSFPGAHFQMQPHMQPHGSFHPSHDPSQHLSQHPSQHPSQHLSHDPEHCNSLAEAATMAVGATAMAVGATAMAVEATVMAVGATAMEATAMEVADVPPHLRRTPTPPQQVQKRNSNLTAAGEHAGRGTAAPSDTSGPANDSETTALSGAGGAAQGCADADLSVAPVQQKAAHHTGSRFHSVHPSLPSSTRAPLGLTHGPESGAIGYPALPSSARGPESGQTGDPALPTSTRAPSLPSNTRLNQSVVRLNQGPESGATGSLGKSTASARAAQGGANSAQPARSGSAKSHNAATPSRGVMGRPKKRQQLAGSRAPFLPSVPEHAPVTPAQQSQQAQRARAACKLNTAAPQAALPASTGTAPCTDTAFNTGAASGTIIAPNTGAAPNTFAAPSTAPGGMLPSKVPPPPKFAASAFKPSSSKPSGSKPSGSNASGSKRPASSPPADEQGDEGMQAGLSAVDPAAAGPSRSGGFQAPIYTYTAARQRVFKPLAPPAAETASQKQLPTAQRAQSVAQAGAGAASMQQGRSGAVQAQDGGGVSRASMQQGRSDALQGSLQSRQEDNANTVSTVNTDQITFGGGFNTVNSTVKNTVNSTVNSTVNAGAAGEGGGPGQQSKRAEEARSDAGNHRVSAAADIERAAERRVALGDMCITMQQV